MWKALILPTVIHRSNQRDITVGSIFSSSDEKIWITVLLDRESHRTFESYHNITISFPESSQSVLVLLAFEKQGSPVFFETISFEDCVVMDDRPKIFVDEDQVVVGGKCRQLSTKNWAAFVWSLTFNDTESFNFQNAQRFEKILDLDSEVLPFSAFILFLF